MATFSQRDIQLLFIGQAATKTTTDIASMNSGEIGIFTPAGVMLTEATAATTDKFIIVKKTPNSGIPLVSGIINKNDIVSAVRKVYVASTEQVSYIGYNGTSGSISVINDNNYHVRISLRQPWTSNHGGLYLKHGFYTSDTSASEYEVASNLLVSLVNEFSKEPDRLVKVEMLSDDAGAAIGGAETLTAVYGSQWVESSGTSHGLVAGDVVRIGGTTVATPVYVVTEVSGANIKLASRYQGTTGSGLAAEELTALTGAFGLKLTGIQAPHRTGKLHSDLRPLIFDVTLENFGTTTYVVATAATAGTGTERQIKELEFFCQGNEGDFYRIGEPNLFDRRVEASGNYDLIDITVQEVYKDSIVAGPINKVYTIALPETAPNYAVAGTADDITDVLEVLAFGSATGALAVT